MHDWSGFSYIVTNLARFVRPNEITFSGVNSTLPMLACLLAKAAYDFDFVYINVAGGGAAGHPREDADLQLGPGAGRRLDGDLRQRGLLRSVHPRSHGAVLPRRRADRRSGPHQCVVHRRLAQAEGAACPVAVAAR